MVRIYAGFDVSNVFTFRMSLDSRPGESGYIAPFYDRLLAGLRGISGVSQVGAAQTLPMHPVGKSGAFQAGKQPSSGTNRPVPGMRATGGA